MIVKAYRTISWVIPQAEVRPSPIHGAGLFARNRTEIGERVAVMGGQVCNKTQSKSCDAKRGTILSLSEETFLAGSPDGSKHPDDCINHSCDHNLWMVNEVTLVARTLVMADDKLTTDYAFWEADSDWTLSHRCQCGSDLCRGRITGRDWMLKELQARYAGHFSIFINERITRER